MLGFRPFAPVAALSGQPDSLLRVAACVRVVVVRAVPCGDVLREEELHRAGRPQTGPYYRSKLERTLKELNRTFYSRQYQDLFRARSFPP